MKLPPPSVNKILVRTPNWLGDAVMALPAVAALAKVYPRASITFLAHRRVAGLYGLEKRREEVIVYDPQGIHRGVKGTARLVRELRKRHYDLAVVFPNSFSSAWIGFLARAKHRIGYATEGRGRLLTTRLPLPKDYRKRHLAESYLNLVRSIGVEDKPSAPTITLSPEVKQEGEAFLHDAGIPKGAKVIGLGPGATYGEAKRWDQERFGELGRKLSSKGYGLVLLGVKEEKALCDKIRETIGDKVVNLAGKTDLRLLAGVLSQCEAFVSNDTGVMHLASALEVPVVGLFGSTSPEWTRPLGRAKVIYKHPYCSPCFARTCPDGSRRCWKAIEADEVYAAVQESMK